MTITFDEDDSTADARAAEDHRRLSLCDAIELPEIVPFPIQTKEPQP